MFMLNKIVTESISCNFLIYVLGCRSATVRTSTEENMLFHQLYSFVETVVRDANTYMGDLPAKSMFTVKNSKQNYVSYMS